MKVLVITNNPVLINEGNAFTDSNTYNILKELTKDDFKHYANNESYLKLLTIINKINFS